MMKTLFLIIGLALKLMLTAVCAVSANLTCLALEPAQLTRQTHEVGDFTHVRLRGSRNLRIDDLRANTLKASIYGFGLLIYLARLMKAISPSLVRAFSTLET